MQFQVPQNIDLEDKIVGPLTLRNFLVLLFGGMFIYALFLLPIPRLASIIISIPVGIGLLAISFVKVQDQPFTKFFTSFVYYLLRPKKRIWNQEDPKPEVKIRGKSQEQKEEIVHPDKTSVSHQAIEKLAQIVDTKGWKPISSATVKGETIDLGGRVKSAHATTLPQTKIEPKDAGDVLEVPPNENQK